MVDPERLARLLRSVSDDVGRLEPHASAAPEDVLGDDVRLDHVKYRFITAIEAVVDTAHHICATEGLRSPATNADAVRELAEVRRAARARRWMHCISAVDIAYLLR